MRIGFYIHHGKREKGRYDGVVISVPEDDSGGRFGGAGASGSMRL